MDLKKVKNLDLHLHTTASDGSYTPAVMLSRVKEAGIGLFALTDHDTVKGCREIAALLTDGDPFFLTGAEFSCKDEEGKYHILGYGFDPDAASVTGLIKLGHGYRVAKALARLEFLKNEFGFVFTDAEIDELFRKNSPGKPHIGALMVKHGYAESVSAAINGFINKKHFSEEHVRPEEAIGAILAGGGIPVLAHPPYGSGEEYVFGEDMERRLTKLTRFGLRGVEAFYSLYTPKVRDEMLYFADRFGLLATAGSDSHGENKGGTPPGSTGLPGPEDYPPALLGFLDEVSPKVYRPRPTDQGGENK